MIASQSLVQFKFPSKDALYLKECIQVTLMSSRSIHKLALLRFALVFCRAFSSPVHILNCRLSDCPEFLFGLLGKVQKF